MSFDLGSLIGGIGSFIGGQDAASGYDQAAKFYKEAGRIAKVAGAMKGVAIQRDIWRVAGTGRANVAAGGLALTGSAKDAIQSNMQQGYLTKAVNVLNTKIEYESYMAQAAQMEGLAQQASDSGMMGLIGGVIGMLSDDSLKENATLVARRGDGIGIYHFNYLGGDTRWEGVMASEVAAVRPDAMDDLYGYRAVHYGKLGLELKQV